MEVLKEYFSRAMVLRSKEYAASCDEQWWHREFLLRHLPSLLACHPLSFPHGTLALGRILAREIHNPLSWTEEYKVVAIGKQRDGALHTRNMPVPITISSGMRTGQSILRSSSTLGQ